jgi:uncharacterized protein YdhG (YjbR/CyaY superfamily)
VDDAVQRYIDRIPAAHRPLFDRVHGLILAAFPAAEVGLSYGMPTYRVGGRRLYLGVWRHGISMYGWGAGRDGGFADRHPDLLSGRGTIRLRPADAEAVPDDDLRALVTAALGD